jgi:hypothetical protein
MKFYIARDGSLEGIRHSIYEEKVLDLLMAKATFEDIDNISTSLRKENR